MCTRTKTSHGCGHSHKVTAECHSRNCHGLERFHYMKEGDCRECKQGGDAVTRGREGRGRYAQELRRRNDPPQPCSSNTRAPLSPISCNPQFSSPWAPTSKRTDDWFSPVRKMADSGWMQEHEKRQRDLAIRSQEHSERSYNSSGENLTPRDQHRRRDVDVIAQFREELRGNEGQERIRSRRRAERSDSYDTLGGSNNSFGSSQSHTIFPNPSSNHNRDQYYPASWDPESSADRYFYHHVPATSRPYESYAAGDIDRNGNNRWKRW